MEKEVSRLKQIVLSLPDKPGVYQYFNDKGEIIYVGKAKNLKRRVSSYFNKDHQSIKTKVLVKTRLEAAATQSARSNTN